MIYRLLCVHGEENPSLSGAMSGCIPDYWQKYQHIDDLNIPRKRVTNNRTRFWFTELGWQKFGKFMLKELRRLEVPHLVKREKNPKRSQVLYQDEYQVAILVQKP